MGGRGQDGDTNLDTLLPDVCMKVTRVKNVYSFTTKELVCVFSLELFKFILCYIIYFMLYS